MSEFTHMGKNIERISDENILSLVSGGNESYVSTETMAQNVSKFYLNLLPFVHCNHTKLKYDVADWQGPDKNGVCTQKIVKTAEISEMSWKKLSKEEKIGVFAVPAGALVIAAGMVAQRLSRWVDKYLPKDAN